MRKILKSLFYIVLLTIITVSFSSCGNRQKKDFNLMLVSLADKDQTIDRNDWQSIEYYLDANKAQLKEFYHDGQLDIEAVKSYITELFEHRRPAKKISFVGIGGREYLAVNFYLERSGSMIAYDSPAGDGSFKAAIVSMLNSLPNNNEDNKIYIVNSSINAYPQGFRKFIADSDIFEATKGIGDAGYTDFGAIFGNILNKTGNDELSILVTDMIYSTKDMAGVNPQKVFAEAQGMTNAVFKDEVKNRAMLIVKMRGSYNGLYYPYNSPSKGYRYDGYRPYYIVVVGSNDNIARLTKDKNYMSFARFASMRGYENMYLFETDDVYKPYCSLLLKHGSIRGRFRPERGQNTQIHAIEDVEPDRNSGDIRLALAVDLSGMLIDDQYLTDKANYRIDADDKIEIKEIHRIGKGDVTPAEKKYIGSATHLFILSADRITHEQDVNIRLLNRMPQWITASSSDDDTHVDSRTTFGLKYLLNGIYSSYEKYSDGEPYYFRLQLKFKN